MLVPICTLTALPVASQRPNPHPPHTQNVNNTTSPYQYHYKIPRRHSQESHPPSAWSKNCDTLLSKGVALLEHTVCAVPPVNFFGEDRADAVMTGMILAQTMSTITNLFLTPGGNAIGLGLILNTLLHPYPFFVLRNSSFRFAGYVLGVVYFVYCTIFFILADVVSIRDHIDRLRAAQ